MRFPRTRPQALDVVSAVAGSCLALALVGMAGCGAVKFYPGEERADSTIGRVLFNSTGADLRVVTIDGVSHPHPGRTVELLPGSHIMAVKYEEHFEPGDTQESGEVGGEPLMRYGSCSLRFTIEAAQELFVFVDAGAHPLIGSSTPPTITLKEQGYYKPALFQEKCTEEGKAPRTKR